MQLTLGMAVRLEVNFGNNIQEAFVRRSELAEVVDTMYVRKTVKTARKTWVFADDLIFEHQFNKFLCCCETFRGSAEEIY